MGDPFNNTSKRVGSAWPRDVVVDVSPAPRSTSTTHGLWDDPEVSQNDSPWFDDEHHQQTTILRQQDQHLDSVMGTVQNIRSMAHTMGNELEDHNALLEELDVQTEQTQSKLSRAMKGMEGMLKSSASNRSICLILFLIAVVFILIALVIFT
ncbi:hypothetical protein IWQ61_001761 [Dispira simplex]|nr:hypothetical protein IWQ61_001761 [Dispira simplex]